VASFLLAGVEWVRVNGRALVFQREPICTVEEYISGEVREELLTWKYYMEQYFRDIRPGRAMQHDGHKRIGRRIRQVRHGV
jgi:hypothetical protein